MDDNGDPELDDNGEEQTEEKEIFVYDERLMSIFFENIADLNDLYAFKQVGEGVGIPGSEALTIFAHDREWLKFVLADDVIEIQMDDYP